MFLASVAIKKSKWNPLCVLANQSCILEARILGQNIGVRADAITGGSIPLKAWVYGTILKPTILNT